MTTIKVPKESGGLKRGVAGELNPKKAPPPLPKNYGGKGSTK